MLGSVGTSFAQGVIPHQTVTLPRGKPSGIPFGASFVDTAAAAGLHEAVIYGFADHKTYVLETLGCGCAFLDYDNDGWLDILMLSGTRLGANPPAASNRLYRNNRDGTFTDVTEKSGLTKSGWACGVCVGDYNNDGFEDLFITYWGQNILYRNNGDGTFTDVTHQARLADSTVRWGTGCTFVDYNRDGFLDLFVSNYMQFDPLKAAKPGEKATCMYKGLPVHCGPRGFPFEIVCLPAQSEVSLLLCHSPQFATHSSATKVRILLGLHALGEHVLRQWSGNSLWTGRCG